MAQRLLTAAVGIPVALALLYLGGIWWVLAVLLLTVAASWEMGTLVQQAVPEASPSKHLITMGGVFFVLLAYQSYETARFLWVPTMVAILIVAFVLELFRANRKPVTAIGATLLGSLYPGVLFAHLVMLRQMPTGFQLALLVLLGTWATDSAAFFVGRTWGKRKLLPSVSPKKTWEGAVGGLFGGGAIGVIMAPYVGVSLVLGGVLGIMVSLAAQVGDLSASALKRDAGLKDTGTLFPGHGGVIDRFDSLLFAGTLVYYSLLIVRGWPMG